MFYNGFNFKLVYIIKHTHNIQLIILELTAIIYHLI